MPDTKDARFARVAEAVVTLLLRGGPDELRFATLAREARVSRPWLYKYFGPDRDALLDFTVRTYGAAFAGVERSVAGADVAAWRRNVRDATARGFGDVLERPWVIELYFRFRHAEHPIGDAVRAIEERHARRFRADLPRELCRSEGRARRFVAVFTAARLGLYHRWLDPAFRASHAETDVLADLEALVEDFVLRRASGGGA